MLGIFLDQETTGLDSIKHSTIDLAFKIIDLKSNDLLIEYQRVVKQPKSVWDLRDENSVMVNGFNWDKVCTGREPSIVEQEIISIFTDVGIHRQNSVYICQNPGFDRAFYNKIVDIRKQEERKWPYHWLDLASMFWCMRIKKSQEAGMSFPEDMNLSKDDIAAYFGLPKEEKPHLAINGVNHLVLCYQTLFS